MFIVGGKIYTGRGVCMEGGKVERREAEAKEEGERRGEVGALPCERVTRRRRR